MLQTLIVVAVTPRSDAVFLAPPEPVVGWLLGPDFGPVLFFDVAGPVLPMPDGPVPLLPMLGPVEEPDFPLLLVEELPLLVLGPVLPWLPDTDWLPPLVLDATKAEFGSRVPQAVSTTTANIATTARVLTRLAVAFECRFVTRVSVAVASGWSAGLDTRVISDMIGYCEARHRASPVTSAGGRVARSGVATRRRGKTVALLGSIGLAIAGIVNAATAGAASVALPSAAAAPSYQYSSVVGAIGIQTALLQNPEPSSIPDLTDVQTPSSDAQLDSFGTSEANAHIGNLNGLGQLPSLVCLASATACNAIPISTLSGGLIQNFPPADPLDAASTYPATQSASAPHVGSKAASVAVNAKPFSFGAGTSRSTAQQYSTTTDAQDGNLNVMSAISIGSIHTSTSQLATASNLTTTATSDLAGIDIGTGKLLHIGSIRSTVTVVSAPKKKPTDTASTVISDVKVLGLPATIDRSGIHVQKGGKPVAVVTAVQNLLNKVLSKAGFGIKLANITRVNNSEGHIVTVNGVEFFFDHTVTGTPPITIGLPNGIPCPIESITSKLPVDPCAGVGLSLNAKYHGQIALGEASVTSLAAPAAPTPSTPPIKPGGPGPTKTLPPSNPSIGGGGGIPSSGGGLPSTGSQAQTGSSPGGSAPTFPSKTVAAADPLAGVSKRLIWFFPLMMIGLLAVVGRLRTPARLPRQL
jgi:hypothetical protein